MIHTTSRRRWLLALALGLIGLPLVIAVCAGVATADWPTYRADIARTGAADAAIGPELSLGWTYQPSHPPRPAWPPPSEELARMHVDNAFHVAIADGTIYFGSSVTDQVYAVDAKSGEVRWTFTAEGPVRFAPTVVAGRVYFGSDDGYVYCLDADNGQIEWQHRAGPSDEKVIGNGRMISLWPVRTSLLVDRGSVYFAAGVFPYEGLYIGALKAEDGTAEWVNDTLGDRAHELEFGGISPHGYLLASSRILYVPSGRAMPAAFDRETGKFLFAAAPGGKRGGTWALLDKDRLIAGVDASGVPAKVAYDAGSGRPQGEAFAWFKGIDMVATADVVYLVTGGGVYAVDRQAYAKAVATAQKLTAQRQTLGRELAALKKERATAGDKASSDLVSRIAALSRKLGRTAARQDRLKDSVYRWHFPAKKLTSVIRAGKLVFAGGQDVVVGIDAESGKEVWRHAAEGRAVGLAVADQHLVVSTDKGSVHCFTQAAVDNVKTLGDAPTSQVAGDDTRTETLRAAARKIVDQAGVRKGYCLLLDCGTGELAVELARQTELKIVGIQRDPAKRAVARQRLAAAGLLGWRVVVEPWDVAALPDYFANLIVVDATADGSVPSAARAEWYRLLRPWGGIALLGQRQQGEVAWNRVARGPLEGSGTWTQQYADPHNTGCSGDELVNGPLGVLWFGDPGPKGMVERHARAEAPVAMDGRLFIEGEEIIMAVDAFNGTLLWRREIPGAVRVKTKADSGNLVITKTGLYVAANDQCYRLDPATGATMRVYAMPTDGQQGPRRWGYISVVDNILYGSTAKPMDQPYAALLKSYSDSGQLKEPKDLPPEYQQAFARFKEQYQDRESLAMAAARSGLLYRFMTSFARGGEFTQKNSVTDNLMTSDRVFALDTETGKPLWTYDGKRIANITIVLGDGKIFFADASVTPAQRTQALADRRELIERKIYAERAGILDELAEKKQLRAKYGEQKAALVKARLDHRHITVLISQTDYLIESLRAELFQHDSAEGTLTEADADVRLVTALDARTGTREWQHPLDLTGCCGDKMGAACSGGLLLMFGNHGNHDAWRARVGGLKWRRITALSTETGAMTWSRPLNYRTRPVIVGDQIILEPQACYLQTGATVMRKHPITGAEVPWEFLRPGHTCGVTAASADGLFYRSASTAFYDLKRDRGVTIFGGYRPGCAISLIPACGLLLSPEAAAGCTCSYPIRCTVVLKRKPARTQPWTVFVSPGPIRPVKHLAVNLGGVADMKDAEGTVWFGYPSAKTDRYTHFPNYGIKLDLKADVLPGKGYFTHDFKGQQIPGTDRPWLFTSGCQGLRRCELPLIDPEAGQPDTTYTVRIGMRAPAADRPGQRVFDIKLQDQMVLSDCDICQLADGAGKAVVKEFTGIPVRDSLVLELVAKQTQPADATAPVINFIEVLREE
jgi:outer membrane protein assembly factor BamB